MKNKNNIKPKIDYNFISYYVLKTDWSYYNETFKEISLTWKLGVSSIEALKIRIATWKPKYNRSNQAIFYFDVQTEEQAHEILMKFKKFNFKKLQDRFNELFEKENIRMKNTGETQIWLLKIIPILRTEFKINDSEIEKLLLDASDYKYKKNKKNNESPTKPIVESVESVEVESHIDIKLSNIKKIFCKNNKNDGQCNTI